jgi:uncharacterized membrane protein YjfL (UPF0719 family)
MTSATTIIALLPILTSTGRGSDIMIPMAIPSFGGMLVAVITYFIVPTLYCWREEWKIKRGNNVVGGDTMSVKLCFISPLATSLSSITDACQGKIKPILLSKV